MNNPQDILFFSEKCPHSKKLLAKIFNSPLYNRLQKSCVDDPQVRSRLPKWVSCVPLIYLSKPYGQYQNVLTNELLQRWVDENLNVSPLQNQQQMPPPVPGNQAQPVNMQSTNTQNARQPGDGDVGFMPYNGIELGGGMSDMYSMFNKDGSNGNLFPHNFETIGGNQSQPQGMGMPPPPPTQTSVQDNNMGSRSQQKQAQLDQELAMKKAMRDQDNFGLPKKNVEGLPEDFNKMWEQQNRMGNNNQNTMATRSYIQ